MNPSFPYYQDIARQRGDSEALRHAADDIDKLRATLDELKALQVNGFDPIAAARAYPKLVEALHTLLGAGWQDRYSKAVPQAVALLRELGEIE